jgi:hypothetical protein
MNKRSPHELARLAVLGGHRCPVISRAPWPNTFLRVYMEKLAKGWPANMAAVAGRRAQSLEQRKPPTTVTADSRKGRLA